jgi:hypothetical protein
MKFTQLTETVSKRPIPPHATHLIAEAMVCDEEGEDVDVCHLSFTHSVIGANHGHPLDPFPCRPHLSMFVIVK